MEFSHLEIGYSLKGDGLSINLMNGDQRVGGTALAFDEDAINAVRIVFCRDHDLPALFGSLPPKDLPKRPA